MEDESGKRRGAVGFCAHLTPSQTLRWLGCSDTPRSSKVTTCMQSRRQEEGASCQSPWRRSESSETQHCQLSFPPRRCRRSARTARLPSARRRRSTMPIHPECSSCQRPPLGAAARRRPPQRPSFRRHAQSRVPRSLLKKRPRGTERARRRIPERNSLGRLDSPSSTGQAGVRPSQETDQQRTV